jgi:N-methylhydantoinase A/oxoprolinase/acetone carboxylase beta subunit
MQHYTIGIDTGGTCTDAVLVEQHTNQILASAKVVTTHYRLSDGISSALSTIMDKSGLQPDRINAIAISTTLATNSVVEKKGARVVLFVIGYVKHFKLPVKAIIYLNGGHTIKGVEEEPLELDYLVESLEKLSPEADAYAVCSAMSMTNPTHELVAEKAISLIDQRKGVMEINGNKKVAV